MSDQEKRLAIVNQLIVEIASRGRKFFYYNDLYHGGKIARLGITGDSKMFYIREWISKYHGTGNIWVYGSGRDNFKLWYHGGTLKSLITTFSEWVITGSYGDHPRGGLYNPHWGYPDEDMEAIQNKAIELGYLKSGE